MNYIPLHAHSSYSFLDSCLNIQEYVQKGKELGMNSLAVTDHGNICGAMEFYKECKKNDVKPILGCEFYIAEHNPDKDRKSYHILCLAMNNRGWRNIIKLQTYANTSIKDGGGYYYKARIDIDTLFKHNEGIICMTACVGGLIPFHMVHDIKKAHTLVQQFQEVFGDRFYLEIQDVNKPGKMYIPEQQVVIDVSREMSKKYGIPCVATNDLHYLNKEDHVSHEILKAISSRKTLNDPVRSDDCPWGRNKFSGYDYYLQTADEMLEKFEPEEVSITQDIADRCNVEITFAPASKIPNYNGLSDDAAYEMLLKIARSKTKERRLFTSKDTVYVERIRRELADVKEASLAHYFLIVNDVCEFSDENKIARGPGRGSAGGSLLSYILNITGTDPIKYDLIWERFYNKGRKNSYPDIDLDFDVSKRVKIIEYLRRKFGFNKVYPMLTIGTMAGKAALKDTGRAIGLPFDYLNKITKKFPLKANTIEKAIKESKTLKKISQGVDKDVEEWTKDLEETSNDIKKNVLKSNIRERKRQLKMLFKHALRLEGCKRQAGKHACAMIISDTDIDGDIPLSWNAKDKQHLTGYDMYTLEELGFLKLDLLGIKSVTVVDIIQDELKKAKIPHSPQEVMTYDDPKIFEMASRGLTKGIFQLESYLGVNWMKKVRPTNLNEWADVIALIRPALLETGLSQQYVDNKRAVEVEYLHDDLMSIFGSTQGVMLYQEQLLEVAKQIAGFSLVEADNLRKAVGKKLPEKMAEYKGKFLEKTTGNGYSQEMADELWRLIEAGASYSFNKSHSVAYAMLGYQMAYYKNYHPLQFYLAMLRMAQQEQKPQEEIAELYYDAKKYGIEICAPDINKSGLDFTIADNKIYFGFQHIKGIGKSSRKVFEHLKGVEKPRDLYGVIKKYNVTQNIMKTLILSGAFDESLMPYYEHRLDMWREIEIFYALTDKRLALIATSMKEQKISFKKAVQLWADEMGDKLRNDKLKDLIMNEAPNDVKAMAHHEEHLLGIPINYCKTYAYQSPSDELRFFKRGSIVLCVSNVRTINGRERTFTMMTTYDGSDRKEATYFNDDKEVHRELFELGQESDVWLIGGQMSSYGSFVIKDVSIPSEDGTFVKVINENGIIKN